MSAPPPGAKPMTMRTGRVGYDCAQAIRDFAASVTAPAHCRNWRRGSFKGIGLRCQRGTTPLRSIRSGLACTWTYLARRQVDSAFVPVDVVGLVYLSSSAVSEVIVRFWSRPIWLG